MLFAEREMVCMMCFQPSRDGAFVSEYDMQTGETWHYCRPCDCWTSHPPEERADGK